MYLNKYKKKCKKGIHRKVGTYIDTIQFSVKNRFLNPFVIIIYYYTSVDACFCCRFVIIFKLR